MTTATRTESWRVTRHWTVEVPNPVLRDRALVPIVRRQYVAVSDVETLAEGWDVYRELSKGLWVPAEAVEWGVDEPWHPR